MAFCVCVRARRKEGGRGRHVYSHLGKDSELDYTYHLHARSHAYVHTDTQTHLPSIHVVPEVNEVLHEPVVDLIQCKALLGRLQDGLQVGRGRDGDWGSGTRAVTKIQCSSNDTTTPHTYTTTQHTYTITQRTATL